MKRGGHVLAAVEDSSTDMSGCWLFGPTLQFANGSLEAAAFSERDRTSLVLHPLWQPQEVLAIPPSCWAPVGARSHYLTCPLSSETRGPGPRQLGSNPGPAIN